MRQCLAKLHGDSHGHQVVAWLFNLLIALVLWSEGSIASADPVAVVNASFEDISGESPFNEFTFGPFNGWDLYDPGNITGGGAGGTYFVGTLTPFEPDPVGNPGVYANFPDGAAEGQRVAIAFNFFGSGGEGEYGLQQTLSETLQANTRYTLEVEIGNIASATAMNGQFFDLDGLPGYRVDLLAGASVLEADDNSLFGAIDDGEFGTSTVTFTTGPEHPQLGQALGIRLVNLNEIDPMFPDSNLEVDFDDVRLVAVPLLPGDYNDDGKVSAADYTVWRDNLGAPAGTLANDIDGGVIAEPQFETWIANYGIGFGSGASLEFASVPEPAAAMLLATAILSAVACRNPKRSNSPRAAIGGIQTRA